MECITESFDWIVIAFCGLQAIVFLQSGLDKVLNYSGNLDWLKGHFAESPLKKMVPLLLVILTMLELFAGVFSVGGILFAVGLLPVMVLKLAVIGSIKAYLALFFGQRMAKDYEGAASLVPYFIVALLGAIYTFYLLG
jgi:hypothetical protein